MKPLLIATLALLALTSARVVPGSPRQDFSFAHDDALNATAAKEDTPVLNSTITTAADLWEESIDRGTKLLAGMKADDISAAALYGFPTSTAESPFDGASVDKLREWGYNDNTPALQKLHDKECNMASASGHMLSKTFAALGMGTASKGNGGPNECFQIEHHGGPAVSLNDAGTLPPKADQHYSVCGTTYRVTGAEHTLGVNAPGGALFALNRKSAPKAARELWRRKPAASELPHLRSASDIAWAVWNRAVASTPGADVRDIRYFMNAMVINRETNQHIRRALQSVNPPLEEAVGWLGTEFSMQSEEGKALLGSPVGRWAGYFLMLHKRQLGGSKWIEKVRVFKSEKEGSWPYLLFYVAGPGDVEREGEKVRAKL